MSEAEPAKYHQVLLFTDGACSGNPGPGGWAYILRDVKTKREKECSGSERDTTNNRMELLAVIEGLKALKRPCEVAIHSDSQYVLNGMKTWMAGWKKKGWRRGSGGKSEPVKNVELWQELDRQMQRHKLSMNYVRGHSGHPENERCDVLAVEAYQNMR